MQTTPTSYPTPPIFVSCPILMIMLNRIGPETGRTFLRVTSPEPSRIALVFTSSNIKTFFKRRNIKFTNIKMVGGIHCQRSKFFPCQILVTVDSVGAVTISPTPLCSWKFTVVPQSPEELEEKLKKFGVYYNEWMRRTGRPVTNGVLFIS